MISSPLKRSVAMTLLVMSTSGCFLFGKSTEPPPAEPAADVPAAPTCEPPEAASPPREGTTLVSMDAWLSDDMVGETVYTIGTDRVNGSLPVGLPLRVCSVQTSTKSGVSDGEKYKVGPYPTYVDVLTAGGLAFKVDVGHVSQTPPIFAMGNLGTAEELIVNLFSHIYAMQMSRRAILMEYSNEELSLAKKVGDSWETNWDYSVERALKESSEGVSKLLFKLVHGQYERDNAMRDEKSAWFAQADDDKILDWFVDGAKNDPANGEVYKAMHECANQLSKLNTELVKLGDIAHARQQKQWRKGVSGNESKLAKLDQTEEKKLDEDKAELEERIAKLSNTEECQAGVKLAGIEP